MTQIGARWMWVNLMGGVLGEAELELWVVEQTSQTSLVSNRPTILLLPPSLRR